MGVTGDREDGAPTLPTSDVSHPEGDVVEAGELDAGDARSCDDTLGPDRHDGPPAHPVVVPAWE